MAAIVLALAAYAMVRLADQDTQGDGAARGTASPDAPTARSPSASFTWSSRRGACGRDVPLPIASTSPLRQPIGVRAIVGGRALVRVGVDTGTRSVLAASRPGAGDRIFALTRSGRHLYALRGPCGTGEQTVLHLPAHGEPRPLALSGPVRELIGGPAGAWGVSYPRGRRERVLLRPVAGGTLRLPESVTPVAVGRTGIVAERGEVYPGGGGLPALVLLDPETGQVTRRIAEGAFVAVHGDVLLWAGPGCRLPYTYPIIAPTRRCVLHRTHLSDRSGTERTYRLPAERAPVGAPVLSLDGRHAAFQLTRRPDDTRHGNTRNGPSSDVAVLDLGTGDLRQVPGLVFAWHATPGLAFAPGARWLVIAVSRGDHGRLLAWRPEAERPRRTPVRVAGPFGYRMPLLLVP